MSTGAIIGLCYLVSIVSFLYCRLKVQDLINQAPNKNLGGFCYFFTILYALFFIISLVALTKSLWGFGFFIACTVAVSVGMFVLITIAVNNKSGDEI